MFYLDTSVLVAALTRERDTARIQVWLAAQEPDQLAISDWVVAEFSSALSIKLRARQIEAAHRADALAMFARLCADTFTTMRVSRPQFALRRGSPTNTHSVCGPQTRSISRSAAIMGRHSVRSIVGSVKPVRRWA